MSGYQRAPDGVWRSSPERMILWALLGVIHKVERDIPEAQGRAEWQAKLEQAIVGPVKKYPWKTAYQQKTAGRVARADSKPRVPSDVTDAWQAIPDLVTTGLWMDAAQERAAMMAVPFDREVIEEALSGTMRMVSSIPDTLRDRLREIMAQAYDEQKGQFGFARQIRAEFADFGAQRSKLIALTEWNRAASAATIVSYKAQGVTQKRWYTLGDDRVCPTCEGNSVDAEIPIDDEFSSGDQYPPAHPGCRCDVSAA